MILTLQKLNAQKIFEHEKLFSALTPEVVNNALTAALLYNKETKKTSIAMKDSLAALSLELECEATMDLSENFAMFFEFSKLMYILRSYSSEDLSSLKIVASKDSVKETSSFIITCAKDKLSLPHMVMTPSQEDDYFFLDIEAPKDHSKFFDWASLDAGQKKDFSIGLTSASLFLDTDEKKNNAVAIYKNKIIANDIKHVFVYRMDAEMDTNLNGWIPLHKRIVKTAVALLASDNLQELLIDKSVVYFNTNSAACKMNNAISNIAPPEEDDLKNISSPNLISKVNAEALKNTSNFFSGFYVNANMNPIKVSFFKDKIMCVLQDSGLADFGSCNIEREIQSDCSCEGDYTIVNDSLKAFLSRVFMGEDNVDIYGEDVKPALRLHTNKMDIYLARLK